MTNYQFVFNEYKSNVDFFLFSKRVQILKTEYKYSQYCTPLRQTDCRYFFVLAITLVIAWLRVQYDQYFPSFSYFSDLFHEPLGQ